MRYIEIRTGNNTTVVPIDCSLFLLCVTLDSCGRSWISVSTSDPYSSTRSIWRDEYLSDPRVFIRLFSDEQMQVSPKETVSIDEVIMGKSKIERFRELESILKERGLI